MQNKQNPIEGCLGKSFWTGVGALATIAALIVAIISIPQASLIRHSISQTFSGTPAITTPPTATPSPTPTPQVISINQTMSCTNCTDPTYNNFSLKVRNATIDPANSQVRPLIEVHNISSYSQTNLIFDYLKLQDLQTAGITNGEGDGFKSFDVAANSLYLVRPTFQFIPVVGHEYSLTTDLQGYIFSPITIKFG